MSRALSIPSGALARVKEGVRKDMESAAKSFRFRTDDILRDVAGELAMNIGKQTFPGQYRIGLAVAAIRFDLSRVYATPGKIYEILHEDSPPNAARFWRAIKLGDMAAARDAVRGSGTSIRSIIIGSPLDPSFHEASRSKKDGRVYRVTFAQMVTKEELDAYSKKIVASLGKTASGWFACAEKLGADGNLIRWMGTSVHGSDGGDPTYEITPRGTRIRLRNHRPLAKKHRSPGHLNRSIKHAKKQLAEKIREAARSFAAAA